MASRGRVHRWQDLTGAQIASLDPERTVVLVTCSPLEVHGPHLPTAADMCESEGLLGAAVERLLERVPDVTFVRLPPVYVAADVLPHRGSLKFSPRTVTNVLTELGSTLARQGFRHLWVGNFHGGPRHILAIERACDAVNRRHGARMLSVFSLLARRLTGGTSEVGALLADIGGISREELRGDNHGGAVETAMLLHLVGEYVDPGFKNLPPRSLELELEEAGRRPVQKGAKATVFEILRGLPLRARYYERETYAGIPARASAEIGRRYLDFFAEAAASGLADFWAGRIAMDEAFSPLWPFRHVLMSETVGRIFDRIVLTRPSPI